MAVFVDVYGNEAREVIPGSVFGVKPLATGSTKPAKTSKKKDGLNK